MKETTNDKSVTFIIALLTLLVAVYGAFLMFNKPKTANVNATVSTSENITFSENTTSSEPTALTQSTTENITTTTAASSDFAYTESATASVSQTLTEQSTPAETTTRVRPTWRTSTPSRASTTASRNTTTTEKTTADTTTASKTTAAVHQKDDVYRILAIGNSFSQDATYFLHKICKSAGIKNEVINLYIQGCSLERHWYNIENQACKYQLYKNGKDSGRTVSVQEVLAEKQFDAIVLQQSSRDSGWINTYEPFLGSIVDYLHKNSKAKIFLNETWAYEKGCEAKSFARYSRNQKLMYDSLKYAYETSAKKHSLTLIRSGEVVQKIRALPSFKSGENCITRDDLHMDYLYGRYAVGMTWAKKILNINVKANTFVPTVSGSRKADMQVIDQIKQIVCDVK